MVEKNALPYPIKRYNGPIKAKLDSLLIYRYLQPIISRNLLQSKILSQLDINQTSDLMQLRCKTGLCLIPRKQTNPLKNNVPHNRKFMFYGVAFITSIQFLSKNELFDISYSIVSIFSINLQMFSIFV